jgi:hypothetical protein
MKFAMMATGMKAMPAPTFAGRLCVVTVFCGEGKRLAMMAT